MEDIKITSDHQSELCILAKIIENSQITLKKRRHFVSLLLEFGADPNLEKPRKDSCLMHAVN